jgi:DNA gyrase subunit A
LMIITEKGLTIRLAVSNISLLGRATQGVRLINLKGDDSIASVARVVNDSAEVVVIDEMVDEDVNQQELDNDLNENEDENNLEQE